MPSQKILASHFATALTQVLEEVYEGRLKQMSDATGVSDSSIGYYCRIGSGRYPTPAQLERLIDPLEDKHKRLLVASYFADRIPDNMRHLVTIKNMVEGSPKKEVALPKAVEEVIERFREAAAKDVSMQHWLMATGRAMLPK
jgi:hypothetical protein